MEQNITYTNATVITLALIGKFDPVLGTVVDVFEGDEWCRPWIEFRNRDGKTTAFLPSATIGGTHYAAYSECY